MRMVHRLGHERVRQAYEQAKDQTNQPTGPRKLNACDRQADCEATGEGREEGSRFYGNDIGNIMPTDTRPKTDQLRYLAFD